MKFTVLTALCCLTVIQAHEEKTMIKANATALFADNGITGDVKDKIISHIKQIVPRDTIELILSDRKDEEDLIVAEIETKHFERDVKFYRLSHRRVLHWKTIYVSYKDRFYTSLRPKDFETLLKDYRFLERSNSLDLFIFAYREFYIKNANIHPDQIVTKDYLEQNSDRLRKYETGYQRLLLEEIVTSQTNKNQHAEISFFVENPALKKITKVTASISPKYDFRWKQKTYLQEKPAQ